jgi:hypothetical protein
MMPLILHITPAPAVRRQLCMPAAISLAIIALITAIAITLISYADIFH